MTISEIELLREYRRVQLELGREPTSGDVDKYGCYSSSTYSRRYGSWTKFRGMMGNPCKLVKQDLIDNYYVVKEKLGKVPNGSELATHGKYAKRTYHNYFGGHRKFLEFIGEKIENNM